MLTNHVKYAQIDQISCQINVLLLLLILLLLLRINIYYVIHHYFHLTINK